MYFKESPEQIYIIKYKKKLLGYVKKNELPRIIHEHIKKYGHLFDFEYTFANYTKSQFYKQFLIKI